MKNIMDDVREMMMMYEQEIRDSPVLPDDDTRDLRQKLLKEEYEEYLAAEEDSDIIEIADALADMVVIIAGTAHAYGIPLDDVWSLVHNSNMSKRDPVTNTLQKREDGKVIKPSTWTPPDIGFLLSNP